MHKHTNARHNHLGNQILERDNNQCVICHSVKDLSIDHIIRVKDNGKSTLENQRTLCRSCHSKITNTKPVEKLSTIGKYLRKWRLDKPTYMTDYHREWRKKHKGYFKKYGTGKEHFYTLANQI